MSAIDIEFVRSYVGTRCVTPETHSILMSSGERGTAHKVVPRFFIFTKVIPLYITGCNYGASNGRPFRYDG
jgi:hypothetical protein